MAYIDFVSRVHRSTTRDYLQRVIDNDKAECAEVAIQFGQEYWDGDRKNGYGGYRYDGRWRPVAEGIVEHYRLPDDARILDVGCGKGFLLCEFMEVLPQAEIAGIDISAYAIAHAKEEVQPFLQLGNANCLPYADDSFDFVVSITTLHNLYVYDLWQALREIQRVAKRDAYLVVEAYRNEQEKVNLMYWQLTCRSFYTPSEWEWTFQQTGYTGDHSLIFFE